MVHGRGHYMVSILKETAYYRIDRFRHIQGKNDPFGRGNMEQSGQVRASVLHDPFRLTRKAMPTPARIGPHLGHEVIHCLHHPRRLGK